MKAVWEAISEISWDDRSADDIIRALADAGYVIVPKDNLPTHEGACPTCGAIGTGTLEAQS